MAVSIRFFSVVCVLLLTASVGGAQQDEARSEPQSLFDLLEDVKGGLEVEQVENARRVQAFERQKEDQARLLEEAKASLARKEALSLELETRYNETEGVLAEREERLTERLGQLGELFGVVRQVATDTSGQVWDSLTSSQLGPRKDLLDKLGRSTALPSTEDRASGVMTWVRISEYLLT